ncbi:MAG: imidazole glycerol phosphate synthase subunit HisH [Deltaproteobacteria bacterium]
MIAIIDYGMGNLKSVEKAFNFLGYETVVTGSPDKIRSASKVVLPGVGAFAEAVKCIKSTGLDEVINDTIQEGKPFLGICLGLQLMFDYSEENGGFKGLGILKGNVKKIDTGLKIPHMGWNSLNIKKESALFKGLPDNPYVYFVHSYHMVADDKNIVTATTDYGEEIEVAAAKDNIFLTQFHPEKSGEIGLKMLKNFIELIP